MMIDFPKLQCAELLWQTVDGIEIPLSKQFGDVYFSKNNGLLETRHVFLNGNELSQRLAQLGNTQNFIVAETGFGTGLNFLALWQLWQQVRPDNHSHVHFISVEKFPLRLDDLKRALSVWEELTPLAQQLIDQYPLPLSGCHRLFFDNERISLDLWFGDAAQCLPLIESTSPVNAWFLDGFAPSCNPELWQEQIFQHIMRLSGSGTTFASFSVAGLLKRTLQSFGVDISRPKGFGHKREMLKAIWQPVAQQQSPPPITQPKVQRVAIVGAGIAGLNCAWAFARRGIAVDLYEKNTPLSGGSGNPLAMLNPKLSTIQQVATHLMSSSWQYATRFYHPFEAFKAIDFYQLQEKNCTETEQLCAQYPDEILQWQACPDSPLSGGLLKNAGVLSPQVFAQQVLAHPCIQLHHVEISHIQQQQEGVVLHSAQQQYHADVLIACNAIALNQLFPHTVSLKPIRGQVSWAKLQQPLANCNLDFAYSYGGYLAALDAQHILFGASFYPNRQDIEIETEDHEHNAKLMQNALPDLHQRLPEITSWHGRASLRAQSPDYLPLVGRVDPLSSQVYALAGLGSKGFLFAPLCSEIIVSQVLHLPLPVPHPLQERLRVNRFKSKSRTS